MHNLLYTYILLSDLTFKFFKFMGCKKSRAYQNLRVERGEADVDNKAKIVFLEILWGEL